jgi:hypothetical protein
MTKPNTFARRIKLKKISNITVSGLVIIFLLFLSLHNHSFCFDNSSFQRISQSESAYPGHSEQFCSACRLYGNVKLHNPINILDFGFFGIVIAFLKPDVLIPSSFLSLQRSPRSPPVIL